jgi:hypothetical protein
MLKLVVENCPTLEKENENEKRDGVRLASGDSGSYSRAGGMGLAGFVAAGCFAAARVAYRLHDRLRAWGYSAKRNATGRRGRPVAKEEPSGLHEGVTFPQAVGVYLCTCIAVVALIFVSEVWK